MFRRCTLRCVFSNNAAATAAAAVANTTNANNTNSTTGIAVNASRNTALQRVSNTLFLERREKILSNLRENKNDKSLAGRVDPQIAPLVSFINENFTCYVTSSSCSGRASLFHKGLVSAAVQAERVERKRGSFGQGTLFQSHDRLHNVESTVVQQLTPALESFAIWRKQQGDQGNDPLVYETELLQLKFEPMIIHILCETMDDASKLLQCATESGQMESGVLSCSRWTSEQRKITCCITSSLRLDIPLFAEGQWLLGHADFSSPEWRALLVNTMTHMNMLFDANEERRSRFTSELKTRLLR
ncbi:tRNA wybutosine-synthesizing protein [Trypanosoma melophagium]|uniref:tRNA wybutosine-synthesizing protein n=1 Tax=Trypanosoma melophagium TaxID=715481 RepID=UPI003519DCCA|nr:tRNA wybutosine-synthesizing protein [Trypanosoma melophagium]